MARHNTPERRAEAQSLAQAIARLEASRIDVARLCEAAIAAGQGDGSAGVLRLIQLFPGVSRADLLRLCVLSRPALTRAIHLLLADGAVAQHEQQIDLGRPVARLVATGVDLPEDIGRLAGLIDAAECALADVLGASGAREREDAPPDADEGGSHGPAENAVLEDDDVSPAAPARAVPSFRRRMAALQARLTRLLVWLLAWWRDQAKRRAFARLGVPYDPPDIARAHRSRARRIVAVAIVAALLLALAIALWQARGMWRSAAGAAVCRPMSAADRHVRGAGRAAGDARKSPSGVLLPRGGGSAEEFATFVHGDDTGEGGYDDQQG